MKPHILVIGGEDHNLRIPFLLELAKRGFQVTAAGTGGDKPFRDANIDYYPFGFDRFVNPLADLNAIGAFKKMIADVKPDVIQTFDTKPNILVPIAARLVGGAKVVRTINGLGWVYSSRSVSAMVLRPISEVLHKLTALWTTKTIFQNRDDQAFFKRRKMIGRGGNKLIPGSGVDVTKFEQNEADESAAIKLRRDLGLEGKQVVITVTRLSKIKGIAHLLAAAALVKKRMPNVHFLLIGQREGEGKLAVTKASLDAHADYVSAIGARSDVPAFLRLADVFAFPTLLREGVPRVLLEASLAGVPIVTTTMPGCVDVVEDSVSGYLVPPADEPKLAQRIIDLLSDRKNALAMAGRAQALVKTEFNLIVTADRYAAVYRDLANRQDTIQENQPASHAQLTSRT